MTQTIETRQVGFAQRTVHTVNVERLLWKNRMGSVVTLEMLGPNDDIVLVRMPAADFDRIRA